MMIKCLRSLFNKYFVNSFKNKVLESICVSNIVLDLVIRVQYDNVAIFTIFKSIWFMKHELILFFPCSEQKTKNFETQTTMLKTVSILKRIMIEWIG